MWRLENSPTEAVFFAHTREFLFAFADLNSRKYCRIALGAHVAREKVVTCRSMKYPDKCPGSNLQVSPPQLQPELHSLENFDTSSSGLARWFFSELNRTRLRVCEQLTLNPTSDKEEASFSHTEESSGAAGTLSLTEGKMKEIGRCAEWVKLDEHFSHRFWQGPATLIKCQVRARKWRGLELIMCSWGRELDRSDMAWHPSGPVAWHLKWGWWKRGLLPYQVPRGPYMRGTGMATDY